MYCIQPSLALDDSIVHCQECFLYTYTGVGLSALLVSDEQGNAKALIAWDGQQTGSALFLCPFVFEDFSKKLGKYHVNID